MAPDDETSPTGAPSPAAWATVFDRSEPPRPAAPDRGPGRIVRVLAGVREELLDWVPEERPRYTRLGLIVFNTGVLAALSLFAALHKIAAAQWFVLLPVCGIWALLVMTFDGWLVASTHGARGLAKWGTMFPRLLISILMGAAIAEPLVLWVFQPAITKEVLAGRQAELDKEASVWAECNPVTGQHIATAGCADYQLSLASSPQPARDQQSRLKAQRDELQREVDGINSKIGGLQQLARDECSGNSGRGLTGQRGEGPNCRQLRTDVNTYRTANGLVPKQRELSSLNTQIVKLDGVIKNAGDDYASKVAAAIQQKVESKRASHGAIGLLEEMAALERLSDKDNVIWSAQWVLRLLLIAIDCMPLLTKAIGGATQYDAIVGDRLIAAGAMHTKFVSFQERSFEQRRRAETEELDAGDRDVRAKRRAHTRKSVDALFEELYSQHGGARRTVPRQHFPPVSDPFGETNVQAPSPRMNGAGRHSTAED